MKLLVSCLMVVLAFTSDATAEWSTYLGSNTRVGASQQELAMPLQLKWVYTSQDRPEKAWSGPRAAPIEGHEMRSRVDFDAAFQVVMAGDRAYFGSTVDNRLYCVDANTGAPLWDFYTDGPIRLAPTLWQNNVYFGSDDGRVYCLRAEDGSVVWQLRVGPRDERLLARGEMISRWPVRTGVLIEDGTAYFGAGVFPHETVFMAAVDALTGDWKWRNDTISEQDAGRNDLSPQGYLLCNETQLFVPSGRSLPVALDRKTGAIVHQRKHAWRTDAGGVVGGTKALLGDGQVYAGGPHHFLAMDQQTGEEGEAWIGGRQMVIAGEYAYIATGDAIVCVDRREHADASKVKQQWFLKAREFRADPAKFAEAQAQMKKFAAVGIEWGFPADLDGALIATENVVVAGGDRRVLVLDRRSGELLWETQVEGVVRGLSVSDGRLMVSTDAGRIYAYSQASEADVTGIRQWPAAVSDPFPDDSLTAMYREAAEQILKRSRQTRGFCLVLGSESGRLAYELAKQSELVIYGIEPNAEQATTARSRLQQAGVHGTRVTIVQAEFESIPFANYFANLVVSESMLLTGEMPCAASHVARFLKPCGGVMMIGSPEELGGAHADTSASMQWLSQIYQQDTADTEFDSPWYLLRRGKLAGAGDWSHQYGNVANTCLSMDERVRDGLGVLWYGDPGPSNMINRHEAAAAPLSTNGRMFIQGMDSLMCYDAYNGTFLWEYENPGALRTGVFNNRETSNLAASDDALYVAVNDTCTVLDAETGRVTTEFQIPPAEDGIPRVWAYIAYDDGVVYGTSTIRQELEEHLRRRGLTVKSKTDAIFAIDVLTGERLWTYRGENLLHTTIAVGPRHMYFIDSSISPEERQRLYQQDKTELKQLTGEAAEQAEREMKQFDLRTAVAIDKRTGEKLWSQPVDVTDTTDVSAGGGSLTVMYADGHLVLGGANANGHYWKQFLAGEFNRRKLIVLNAENGRQIWAKDANYMNRPAVIGQTIMAEPWAFDLQTGEAKKRPHPLTGEESDWRFSRPGHHCGVITATPNMMFFRSGFIGYYDLYQDSGTRHFAGQRLGCWINAIPGNGLVMIPEASAGCVCLFSITSTVVLEPKSENHSWGIFSAVGPSTPVKQMCINLGAPGDRKDNVGKSWFGFPRPSSNARLEYVFDIQPEFVPGGGWHHTNAELNPGDNSDAPWLYASGARGLSRCVLPLLGEHDAPADYTVKLHLLPPVGAGELALPTIRVQGQVVALRTDGEATGVYVTEHVAVNSNMEIAIAYPDGVSTDQFATLAAIEVVRE